MCMLKLYFSFCYARSFVYRFCNSLCATQSSPFRVVCLFVVLRCVVLCWLVGWFVCLSRVNLWFVIIMSGQTCHVPETLLQMFGTLNIVGRYLLNIFLSHSASLPFGLNPLIPNEIPRALLPPPHESGPPLNEYDYLRISRNRLSECHTEVPGSLSTTTNQFHSNSWITPDQSHTPNKDHRVSKLITKASSEGESAPAFVYKGISELIVQKDRLYIS